MRLTRPLLAILLGLSLVPVTAAAKGAKSFTATAVQTAPNTQSQSGKIFVSDTGRGMSVDEVSRAMEPFRQIHDKNTPNEGTGLGLPLTKKLVEIQGGSLSIKSTPNIGTTVEVHFPKVGMALSA